MVGAYRGSLPQGLLDISETEAARYVCGGANTVHVPGALQTSEQAMAIFAPRSALPEHEGALRLALRSERQRVITGEEPVPYVAVVHEAALRCSSVNVSCPRTVGLPAGGFPSGTT